MCDERALLRAAELLKQAHSVVCLTGAGVSAESGIATFRDAQTGLWSRFDPRQLASQAGFAQDPALVWRWYMERLQTVEQTTPNPGHRALADLESLLPRFDLFTQNVDDLHDVLEGMQHERMAESQTRVGQGIAADPDDSSTQPRDQRVLDVRHRAVRLSLDRERSPVAAAARAHGRGVLRGEHRPNRYKDWNSKSRDSKAKGSACLWRSVSPRGFQCASGGTEGLPGSWLHGDNRASSPRREDGREF